MKPFRGVRHVIRMSWFRRILRWTMFERLRITSLAATAVVVAACASAGGAGPSQPAPLTSALPPTATPAMPSASGELSPPAPSASAVPASAVPTATPPIIDAAWAQTELTDVATGESFRIADLAGKAVIVETMAIWCTNCRAQQGEVYRALDDLDPDRVAYVLLDVDPNETAAALADYRTQNGFTGTYAIAGRETARALAVEFGDQVLNPPSTPIILVGTDGRITLTDFGHKSSETIVELARDHGA
jgi:thiol-disulfide isomerase/thioredoxin